MKLDEYVHVNQAVDLLYSQMIDFHITKKNDGVFSMIFIKASLTVFFSICSHLQWIRPCGFGICLARLV